jgi:hypothetical protein
MRNILLLMIAVFVGMGVSVFGRAQQDDGFKQFYADFQSAVKAGDKEKVAGMISFDSFNWETLNRESPDPVKTKEAFLKNYHKMFTPAVKAKIATARVERNERGNYFIIWHTKWTQYELYFAHEKDGSYKFLGLQIGAY